MITENIKLDVQSLIGCVEMPLSDKRHSALDTGLSAALWSNMGPCTGHGSTCDQ